MEIWYRFALKRWEKLRIQIGAEKKIHIGTGKREENMVQICTENIGQITDTDWHWKERNIWYRSALKRWDILRMQIGAGKREEYMVQICSKKMGQITDTDWRWKEKGIYGTYMYLH